ncbi:MAG: hypothetical protein EPO21_24260 [Chloroflexota bacterium]|nr:MAG: hypothetical protein EPO21_24260 [Chloroflexota bacterium]
MNLATDVERNAARLPDKLALVFEERRYTFRDYDEQCNRVANALCALGVERGDRVAIMLPGCPEYLFTFHGLLKVGAIAVSVNILLKSEETRYILHNSQSRVVVVAASHLPVLQAVRDQLPELSHVVVVGGDGGQDTLLYQALLRDAAPTFVAVDVAPDERATIFYTSGTTGVPKGAVHTHENLVVQLDALRDWYKITDRDVAISLLPVSLLSVLIVSPLTAMHSGCTCVLMDRFNAAQCVRLIKEWRVTLALGAVPTMYYEISRLPEEIAREVDLSSVRYAICGGSPLPPELRREFEGKYDFRIINSYGGTEAPCTVTTDPLHHERKFDAVGVILPHIKVKIVDDDDNELPLGQTGEICIGPHTEGPYAGVYKTLKEYWRMPEATAEALKGGFFHFGDLGYLDEDGFLYLVDRKKDMIIRGGHNVYPKELENVLYEDTRIQECAVLGVPHERLGEVPKAYILLRAGAQAAEQEFIDMIQNRLAKFKALEHVEFVQSFPRNAMGKILKRELRDLARAQARQISQG